MPNHPNQTRPVAIITGGGSGIGLASAHALARSGFDLLLVGRREEPLHAAGSAVSDESPGRRARPFRADVADAAGARRIVAGCLEHFGRIDCLVNNAGLAPLLPIDETTPEVLHEVFAVNAVGPGALIAACWPAFVAQRSGCVVNISTMGTADPFPGFFAYAAAKSAVNSFARSVAREGAEHNIKGFAIAPGAVETAMFRALFNKATVPPSATLAPDAVAQVVAQCATGERDTQNGTTIFLPNPS